MSSGENEPKLLDALGHLSVHDHLCLIYQTREEQFGAAIPFIRMGLERGERCVYITDENTAEVVLKAVRAEGVSIDRAITSGSLMILSKKETYLKEGHFDPDVMIGFLEESVASVKASGFSALRVTAEMTWALGGDPGVERLMEYEAELNRFFPKHDALAICQYNLNRFDPEVIIRAIKTHPKVIFGNMVCENLYYVPPDELLKPDQPLITMRRLLDNIIERERVERALSVKTAKLEAVNERLGKLANTSMTKPSLHGLPRECKLLLDSTDEGIYCVDNEERVILVNRAALKMIGYSRRELLGKHWHELVHHSYADGSPYSTEKCPTYFALRAGRGTRVDAEVFWRKDGTSFPVEYSSFPIGDGAIKGAVIAFSDITERKQAEELSHALNRINLAVSSTLDFDEIMRRVFVEVGRAIGTESASITLREGDHWVVRYAYGFPEDTVYVGLRLTDEQAPHGVLATKTREPVVINDALKDDRVNREVMEWLAIRSVVVIPLVLRESAIGLLYLNYHSAPIAFSDTQVDFARKIATSVSLALENAHLYEERRLAAEALKEKDRAIRLAYVDVIGAVTGGKLVLMTPDEVEEALGEPITDAYTITLYEELAGARKILKDAVKKAFPMLDLNLFVVAVCEALTNAIKHAGGDTYRLFSADGTLQIVISDTGPGIDFTILPKATLVAGFSTKVSLGMGFSIMLELCDRVLLSTQPGNTTVVLETEVGR
ncbi:MAG: MEDS domain-containing protein [Candidatus Aquicultorales bacterium]